MPEYSAKIKNAARPATELDDPVQRKLPSLPRLRGRPLLASQPNHADGTRDAHFPS